MEIIEGGTGVGTQSGKQLKQQEKQPGGTTVSDGVQGIVEGAALLGEYIREDQSKEYLVDGAVLTCTGCTKNVVLITIDGEVFEYYAKKGEVEGTFADKSKIYGRLTVTENENANIFGQQYATVADSQKEKNIPYFGNCSILPANKMEKEKLKKIHNEAGFEKRKEGSCKYLMSLNNQWEIYELGKGLLTFGNDASGEVPRITMTSTLFCTHGGFIYPVSSGQAVARMLDGIIFGAEDAKEKVEKEKAKGIKAFIPQKVSNEAVVVAMEKLSVDYPVAPITIQQNEADNLAILTTTATLCESGKYIENQASWSDVKYGNKSTMDKTGCGIIASYNALLALGESVSEQTMVDLISRYEQNGAVLYGEFGTSPLQIVKCFEEKGYDVTLSISKEEAAINDIGDNSDTVIATVYNNKYNVMDQLHTVSITKDANGKFSIHNTGLFDSNANSYLAKDNNGLGYDTLHDAICDVSGGDSMNISVIGISKPTNNTP